MLCADKRRPPTKPSPSSPPFSQPLQQCWSAFFSRACTRSSCDFSALPMRMDEWPMISFNYPFFHRPHNQIGRHKHGLGSEREREKETWRWECGRWLKKIKMNCNCWPPPSLPPHTSTPDKNECTEWTVNTNRRNKKHHQIGFPLLCSHARRLCTAAVA